MGIQMSRSSSRLSLLSERQQQFEQQQHGLGDEDIDDDSLDGHVRREDMARFPYVEFTGRDSITCPTCQGTGRIPSGEQDVIFSNANVRVFLVQFIDNC